MKREEDGKKASEGKSLRLSGEERQCDGRPRGWHKQVSGEGGVREWRAVHRAKAGQWARGLGARTKGLALSLCPRTGGVSWEI